MPVHERRQHFRIDDHIYFEFREIKPGEVCSDLMISKQLLGEQGMRYMEAVQYFQDIDNELSDLTQNIALEHPGVAHYLNLLNSKIDYISRQVFMGNQVQMRKVNISLGGMAFKTDKQYKLETHFKMVIYTKPKMSPILVDATVVYCQYQGATSYRTAVEFEKLNLEQEQLLSQHIMLAQIKSRAD